MQTEVVTPGKGPVTQVALEGFAASVFPQVSGQLVRAGKLPVAAFPAAEVGLLSSVGPLVGLQVAALGVHLKLSPKLSTSLLMPKVCEPMFSFYSLIQFFFTCKMAYLIITLG